MARLRPPEVAAADGPPARSPRPDAAPAGERPAAALRLPDSSRRWPRPHLQREPRFEQVPLLRRRVSEPGGRDRPVGGVAPDEPARRRLGSGSHLRPGAVERTREEERLTDRLTGAIADHRITHALECVDV